jgi:curved DNA-binding protein CbpA
MTHYETLGVSRDATPGAIRVAFRKAASGAHPDREGGDAERMAEINRAYEVLMDVDRRKRYDETGADDAPVSRETVVANLLMAAINSVIESSGTPLLDKVRDALNAQHQALAGKLTKITSVRATLHTKRGKIKTDGERNLFDMVLDQKIGQLDASIEAIGKEMGMFTAAIAEIKKYRSIEEIPIPRINYGFGTGTTNATWTAT